MERSTARRVRGTPNARKSQTHPIPSQAVHLIDASPYIFRAWFALPSSLVDRAGNPTAAVYGFTSFLLAYLDEQRPTHLALTFDESLNTARSCRTACGIALALAKLSAARLCSTIAPATSLS